MKPIAIGTNKDLEYRFTRASKQVNNYLKQVSKQLTEYDLKISVSDLLSNPKKAIKNAYIAKHEKDLPKFLSVNAILDNFTFDFTYIDSIFNKPNNEIYSAFKTFKCDEQGLIKPDFNYYATNENQINLYYELLNICKALNEFQANYKGKIDVFLGMIPKQLSTFIETNISNAPELIPNAYRISNYKK
jgi:hypothetical protein